MSSINQTRYAAKSASMALLFLAALATATGARAGVAPQPETLKLVAYYDIGEQRYREIEVGCSNRSEALVYKTERRRQWCVGGPAAGECFRDNISAAKQACANAQPSSLAKR